MKNKTILYTVCSYLPEDKKIVDNLMPNINGMKKWANYIGMDFEIIDQIPNEVEDVFVKAKQIWNHKKLFHRPRDMHMRKAWITKIESFHRFYKSDYEQVMFLDCDMMPRADKGHLINLFDFKSLSNYFYCNLKKSSKKPNHQAVWSGNKEFARNNIDKKIKERVNAQVFFLTKDFEFNVSDMWSYENLLELALKDYRFLREEVFMSYMLTKTDIIDHVKTLPWRLYIQDIYRNNKQDYIYQNNWENVINE